MRLLKLLLVMIACTAAGPAVAGPYEDGFSAYARDDYATAATIFRKLAEQGNAKAQYWLGIMYFKGRGVPQDHAQSFAWFRKAAERGHDIAQFELGIMYDRGPGVPQDYVQAHKWFNLAASNFRESEKADRDKAAKRRDELAAKMTPAQIAEAQRLMREWKPTPNR